MFAAGIDIGTTNLELSLVSLDSCRIVERRSAPVKRVATCDPYAFLQDAAGVLESVEEMLASIKQPIGSIGITGQVHGIVYTDDNGKPLSPLYGWLDRHGTEDFRGSTPQKILAEKTGVTLPAGYGLLTHYANRLFHRVPEGAARFTGINELVAGFLARKPLDAADASDLACFGGFDPAAETQNTRLLEEVMPSPLPKFLGLAKPFSLAGTTRSSIPVAVPVGDNQTAFFGLLSKPEESCLVSIGTSGQISVYSKTPSCPNTMELRPFIMPGYLQVGATLCAGKAYEVLASLFREAISRYAASAKLPLDIDDGAIFDMMKGAAREILKENPGAASLVFDTAINGTRRDNARRGSIANITLDNFNVGNLVLGGIDGIVRELADFRKDLGPAFDPIKSVVVAGSAVRKNDLFIRALERQFDLEIKIPPFDGGAALGAALIGAVAGKLIALGECPAIIERFWEKD
ncbi:sedoheptulokinase [Leadbettera azotonutricia]|uniref:FGGY domain protein n=1 Tax=Leadbettera azotonutricia (strain ATCC BAA-888 / DSM 13862 / ZAS-9) TaxID=545695 RepID=F5YAN2_LEAAZ|nr:FGGY-family carbohydrate kinase [Leadbettera azotonutricia]AEF82241.1 FGGY domain protein [Leadbettera azotonutricia ZAS-9]